MSGWRNILFALTVATVIAVVPRASSAGMFRVTIAQVGDFFLYAPLYVALDAGLFQSQGLDVNIVNTGGDEKSWAAVLTGEAQFGVGDPTFIAISASRGRPGSLIGTMLDGVPFWGVTYRTDVPNIREPRDLKGFSVATFPAPSTAYTLQKRMFDAGGLEPTIRQGAFGALLPMVKAGQADIALELEPNVSRAASEGARVIYSLADVYGRFAVTGVTADPAYLARNPAVAEKVMCGLQGALDLMRKDPARALTILARRFPETSHDVAGAAFERVLQKGIVPTQLIVAPESWKSAIDLRVRTGDMKDGSTASSLVDNRFAVAASLNPACRR